MWVVQSLNCIAITGVSVFGTKRSQLLLRGVRPRPVNLQFPVERQLKVPALSEDFSPLNLLCRSGRVVDASK